MVYIVNGRVSFFSPQFVQDYILKQLSQTLLVSLPYTLFYSRRFVFCSFWPFNLHFCNSSTLIPVLNTASQLNLLNLASYMQDIPLHLNPHLFRQTAVYPKSFVCEPPIVHCFAVFSRRFVTAARRRPSFADPSNRCWRPHRDLHENAHRKPATGTVWRIPFTPSPTRHCT